MAALWSCCTPKGKCWLCTWFSSTQVQSVFPELLDPETHVEGLADLQSLVQCLHAGESMSDVVCTQAQLTMYVCTDVEMLGLQQHGWLGGTQIKNASAGACTCISTLYHVYRDEGGPGQPAVWLLCGLFDSPVQVLVYACGS